MTPAVRSALRWFADQPAPVALFSTVEPGVPSPSMRRKLQDRGLIERVPDERPVGLIAFRISEAGRQALTHDGEPPQHLSLSRLNRALCARVGVRFNGQDMGQTVKAYDVKQGWIHTIGGGFIRGRVEPYWRT